MKKLLSILLVVVMLGSVTVYAENTPAIVISDSFLEATTDDGTHTVDLRGLKLILAPILEGEIPGLCLNILGNDQVLFSGEALLQSASLLLSMDGLSKSFYVPFAGLLTGMSGTFGGVAMPNLRLIHDILQREAVVTRDGDSVTVRLPYTAMNTILMELLPVLGRFNYRVGTTLQAYLQRASVTNSGYEGVFRFGKTDSSVQFFLYGVENGVASEDPSVQGDAALSLGENGVQASFRVAADKEGNGQLRDIVDFNAFAASGDNDGFAFGFELRLDDEETGELEGVFGVDGTVIPEGANTRRVEIQISERDYYSGEYGVLGILSGTISSNRLGMFAHLDAITVEDGVRETVGAIDASLFKSEKGYTFNFLVSDVYDGTAEGFFRIEGYLHREETGYHFHIGTLEKDYSTDSLEPTGAFDATVKLEGNTASLRLEISEEDYESDTLRTVSALEASVTFGGGAYDFRFLGESYSYLDEQLVTDFLLEGTLRIGAGETALSVTSYTDDYSSDELVPRFAVDAVFTRGEIDRRLQLTLSSYDSWEEKLVPQFAFDGMLSQTPSARLFSATVSTQNYYTDELEKQLLIAGTVMPEENGASLAVQIYRDLEGYGELAHVADIEGSVLRDESGVTVHGALKIALFHDEDNFVDAARFDLHFGSEFSLDAEIAGEGVVRLTWDPATGALRAEVVGADFRAVYTATVTFGQEDVRRSSVGYAGAVNLLRLTGFQRAQFRNELQSATADLLGFIMSAVG